MPSIAGRLARHGEDSELQRGDQGEGGPAGAGARRGLPERVRGDDRGRPAAGDRQRGDAAQVGPPGRDGRGEAAEAAEVRALKRKVSELERTIQILTEATRFFAREADPLRR